VKLLLDENLSRRIVSALRAAFPETTQVALAALETASDRAVWEFAKAGEFTIVTKDEDFIERTKGATHELNLHDRQSLLAAETKAAADCHRTGAELWAFAGRDGDTLGMIQEHANDIRSAGQRRVGG
jgi:hypothetical protein